MKKEAKDWWIAMTHFLTAGFVIPLIIIFPGGIILLLLNLPKTLNHFILSPLIGILGLYLGVRYSARYLTTHYYIKDKNKIARLATSFYFVIVGPFILFSVFLAIISPWLLGPAEGAGELKLKLYSRSFWRLFIFIINISLFYIFSKRWIVQDEVAEKQEEIGI